MSLSLAIALNVLADITILGLLALVMSRAARLTPHGRDAEVAGLTVSPHARAARPEPRPRTRKHPAPLAARS
jgi:hypothetical protein